jgi:hypothetical protein
MSLQRRGGKPSPKTMRKVSDKRLLKLIGRYLRAGIMVDGLTQATAEGTMERNPIQRRWRRRCRGGVDTQVDPWESTAAGVHCVKKPEQLQQCFSSFDAFVAGIAASTLCGLVIGVACKQSESDRNSNIDRKSGQ